MGEREAIHLSTLDNGIRVAWLPRPGAAIAHCALMIEAGSRDEQLGKTGLAHYIEHSLFKGTKHRKTFHILNRLDSVGGDINAYTSKEDTTLHASFLKEHSERAIELIADIAFHSTFPEKEIEKEKDVIIDEIQASLENPSERIFEDFDELFFPAHPLGHPILGSEEDVRRMKRNDVLEFIAERYQPANMIFAFTGDIRPKMLDRYVRKYLADYPSSGVPRPRSRPVVAQGQHIQKTTETQQAHVVLGSQAYDVHSPRRLAFILLNNMLGGPAMNNLLGLHIRERYGIAYNLESHYSAFSDTGLFQIYLSTEKKTMDRAIQLVNKELNLLKNKALGVRQLQSAKTQLKGQIALGAEGAMNTILGISKSLLLHERVEPLDEVMLGIDSITASDLLEVANEVWESQKMNTLVYA